MRKKIICFVIILLIITGCKNVDETDNKKESFIKESGQEQTNYENKKIGDIEITTFEEVMDVPELDDKLESSLKLYDDEGIITTYVNGSSDYITFERKIDEDAVTYIFSDREEELFSTPQIENYNSFEYIQYCDINSDDISEILVATYVQNSSGYEVREFYIYGEKNNKWQQLASFAYDEDSDIANLLNQYIDGEDANMDVSLTSNGINMFAYVGKKIQDKDGYFWDYNNYHIVFAFAQ